MPKLYFYDTGLAIALLGVESASQLSLHPFKGNLFENLVIVEFLKRCYNLGKPNNLFFWRDNTGNEIDLVIERGNNRVPVEIKSGQTVMDDFFKGIRFWNKLTGTEGGFLIYGGDMLQKRSNGVTVVPLKDMHLIEI